MAILGILAAVVVPNVSKFVGSGSTEAANTERTNVQAAMDAAWITSQSALLGYLEEWVVLGLRVPVPPSASRKSDWVQSGTAAFIWHVDNDASYPSIHGHCNLIGSLTQ